MPAAPNATGCCAKTPRLRARANETYQLDQIVGESPKMRELRQLIQTVAPTDARVLILGESGTGKELVAGALHSLSQRRQANYVRINCAAIPETLLESELFGHEKGAFTGALKQKLGRVEEADGGTIFLDEIADMSRPLQAKLLRFLEDGTFTRVGGTQELRVNVRLIAATNRDIIEAIARRTSSARICFHRLNVVQFRLPPLRERGEDVLLLAEHFLKLFGHTIKKPIKKFSRAARQKLLAHHWPGNVRELRNVIERALILETTRRNPARQPAGFSDRNRIAQGRSRRPKPVAGQSLDEMMANLERELVTAVLEQNHFSLTRTAEQLKISRHALRYRMQRLNITTENEGDDESAGGSEKDSAS